MTDEGPDPPRAGSDGARPAPVLGWRSRLEMLQRAVMRLPIVLAALDVMRAYDRAGGGMLAGGLSYFGFFTMVPALLLFVSLVGVLVEDPTLRQQLIDGLVGQLDPIHDVAVAVINGLAGSGRTGTIIGIIGLLWGASGFYGALQTAMQRMFPGPKTMDFLRTRLRGILAVALILGSMLAAVVVIFVVPFVVEWLTARCTELEQLGVPLFDQLCTIDLAQIGNAFGPVAAIVVAFLGAMFVYVAISPNGPSVRQALVPAVIAGVAIGLLTSLFGFVAPLIVRSWQALGIVGSVFIALVWFNLVFQALLYGAALARLRRDRERARQGPPSF